MESRPQTEYQRCIMEAFDRKVLPEVRSLLLAKGQNSQCGEIRMNKICVIKEIKIWNVKFSVSGLNAPQTGNENVIRTGIRFEQNQQISPYEVYRDSKFIDVEELDLNEDQLLVVEEMWRLSLVK